MPDTKKQPHRLRWFSAILIAACAVPFAILLQPISQNDVTFTVESSELQRSYHLEVEYGSAAVSGESFPIIARLSAVKPEIAETTSSMGAMQVLSEEMDFDSEGVVSAPFPGSKTVTFSWQATPRQAGNAAFTLFFSRQYLDPASGKLVEQTVWAKSFPITVRPGIGPWKEPVLFFSGCGFFLGILLLLIGGLPARRRRV